MSLAKPFTTLTGDFRALNDASEPLGYPLPNIHTMLRRIGDKHPAYFAVIDFTSGYHQMPLADAIRKFTAFITEWGQYHWNRVPMGLKGATSYFQMTMTNILRGLVHDICEVYIDDVIVYATSEEELLRNLDLVFERIAEAGLVINPRKCVTGKSQVEYVGFIINKYGLTISADKRDVVRRIARPASLHELRSFLGLTNYFRQMIARYADIAAPLETLKASVSGKHQKLVWTDAANTAFEELKTAVDLCPTLAFLDSEAPIILETDASDYGIGGCLYQLINGEQRAVEFFSKALHGPQLRWNTTEKEAYAIYAALKKWEHMLKGGPRFTIRTDHRALIYLNSKYCSDKVHRWKLAIQPFNFQIEHIQGKKNEVADALSRLMETPAEQVTTQLFAALFADVPAPPPRDDFSLGTPDPTEQDAPPDIDIPDDKRLIIARTTHKWDTTG